MSEDCAGGLPLTSSIEARATSSAFPANSLSRLARKRTWGVWHMVVKLGLQCRLTCLPRIRPHCC
jgi:hypothetical protein